MNEDPQIDLNEAIRSLYNVEPLKIDLPAAVAKRVTYRQKRDASFTDNALYLAIGLIVAGSIIYCAASLDSFYVSQVLLVSGIFCSLSCLSALELWIFSRWLHDLKSRQ